MYINHDGSAVERVDWMMNPTVLNNTLSSNSSHKLSFVDGGLFGPRLWLLAGGTAGSFDGELLYMTSPTADPMQFVGGLDAPGAVLFTNDPFFGDLAILTNRGGLLRAFRPDGTFFILGTGFMDPRGLAMDAAGSGFYIVERGRGRVFHLQTP